MKYCIRKLIAATLVLLCCVTANAHDFEVDGIFYNISGDKAVVTYKGSSYDTYSGEYSGSVVVPENVTYNGISYSVTSIGNYAFAGCSSLTSITIPNSVTSIGVRAFYECTNLKTVINLSTLTITKGKTSNGYAGYYADNVTNYPNGSVEGDFIFAKIDGNNTLCIYTGNATQLSLPENYNGGNYVIGEDAFEGCKSLTSVTIPNSVTSIGNSAFYYCSRLKTVINLSSLTISKGSTNNGYVGYYADKVINAPNGSIEGDFVWAKIDGNNTLCVYIGNATELSLPENYKGENYVIGELAFYYCSSLTSITIPNSVTSIGNYAFYNCNNLTSITIPNSVTSIGEYAFHYCSGLTSVTIGNGVTSIGNSAFYYCSRLKTVINLSSLTISKGSSSYGYAGYYADKVINAPNVSIEGDFVFKKIDKVNTLVAYIGNDTELILPVDYNGEDYVIGSSAFYNCSSLTSVTIPNSVISIGSSAFCGCKGLTSVTIPNRVTSIGSSAFSGCSGLTSVTIPNSVTSIGDDAFENCKYIKKAIWLTNTPPKGYKNIEAKINYVANDQYSGISNAKIYPYLSSIFEVDGVKYVPVSPAERTCDAIDCLYDSTSADILIDKTVQFKGVAMSVKEVMPYTFFGNKNVKSVELNNNGNIGDYAFSGCSSLGTATVSNSGNVGDYAFSDCSSLGTATVSNNGNIGDYAFSGCSNLVTATLGNSVKLIGASAFYGCSKLKDIVVPDAVTAIGSNAFYGCSSLQSAKIGNGVKSINNYAFRGCSAMVSVALGDSVTTIGENAFYNCSVLPEIRIPNSVTKIGNYAFDNCTSLADVVIEDRATSLSLGSNGSSPLFGDCPLDSVYIGGKIDYNKGSSYGYSPFYRNTSLRTVVITNKEEKIYDNEFYGCSNLKNVSIGNGVTSIGKWAFSGCSNLDYFAFGKNVQNIGEEAFSDCTNLTMLISQAVAPPTCGTQALDDINKWNCTLYVPSESMMDYQAANQWKDFFFINEIPTGIDDVHADVPTFEITADGILFTNAEGKTVAIYSISGALVEKIDAYAGKEIVLDKGVYIVRVGGKAVKVKL